MQTIIPIPALRDNYIWMLWNTDIQKAWVVDPGDSKPVIEALNQYQITLAGILVTHHHDDHCNGVPELLNFFGDIPVVGSYKSPREYISLRVKENDEIVCFDQKFKVMEIPGHTLDHTAYYGNTILFCGDTLFSAGCGRIFEGTPEMMYHTLGKLKNLNNHTEIYCGHEYTLANLYFAKAVEPNNASIQQKIAEIEKNFSKTHCTLPSILSEEKKINPFFRCDIPEVIHAAEKFAGKKLGSHVEVFGYLREWKNGFVFEHC